MKSNIPFKVELIKRNGKFYITRKLPYAPPSWKFWQKSKVIVEYLKYNQDYGSQGVNIEWGPYKSKGSMKSTKFHHKEQAVHYLKVIEDYHTRNPESGVHWTNQIEEVQIDNEIGYNPLSLEYKIIDAMATANRIGNSEVEDILSDILITLENKSS